MSAGTIFCELDLDFSKFEKNQQKLLQSAKEASTSVEKNWQNLGVKSDNIFQAMRASYENSYNMIKAHVGTTTAEIARAHEAMAAKIKAVDEQQYGHQTTLIEGLKKNWMIASATVIGAFYAMQRVFQLSTLGANVKSIEESFTLLSKNAGIAGDQLILKLQQVTNATIDSSDLMRKANRLIVEGFSAKQIIQIGEAARVAARIMGTDVSAAYEQVADAIVNLRQRGLKTAGFVIDLSEAYQKQADRLGISVKYLNDYGKQMALAAAVEEKRIEILKKMGPLEETESERIQKLTANWKDLKENIGKATLELISFFFIEGRSKTLLELFGIRSPKTKSLETPSGYPTESERRFEGWGGQSTKSQEDIAKKAEDQLKLNLEYGKKILGIGYLTYQDKVNQLEAERKIAIEQGKGLDVSRVNEFFNKQIVELKKLEIDRVSTLNINAAKTVAEAQKLSDLGQMPSWEDAVNELQKGYMIMEGIVWKTEDYIKRLEAVAKAEEEINKLAYETPTEKQMLDMEERTKQWEDANRKLLSDTADFYSKIIGYEDEYRKKKFEWIEEERKHLKELYGDEIAAAKWARDEKIKFDANITTDKLKGIEGGMAANASAFEELSQLYAEDSKQRKTLHDISMAFSIAERAAKVAEAIVAAVTAIATQGKGDPYTAFTRIAAMTAAMVSLLASIGASLSGGAESAGYTAGGTALGVNTTVLGGTEGQGSESVDNVLKLLEDTYSMENQVLSRIYNEMKTLNLNITGLVTNIIRTGGIAGAESYGVGVGFKPNFISNIGTTTLMFAGAIVGLATMLVSTAASAFVGSIVGTAVTAIAGAAAGASIGSVVPIVGTIIGAIIGFLIAGIFGGGKETLVGATGIELGKAKVGELLAGEGMTGQQYAEVMEIERGGWFSSTSRDISTYYAALDEKVTSMFAKVFKDLGSSLVELAKALGTDVQAALDYVFPGGKINLRDMDAEAINKTISEFISSAADAAVEALFGQMLRSYQKVGEGLLETAVRLINDKEIILATLKMTGQAFAGTIPEIIAFSEAIITMAGDLEKLTDAAEKYFNAFFTDAEKQAKLQEQLNTIFGYMGIVLPDARQGFRDLVESLDLTTEAGQMAYVTLLNLSEQADAYYKYLEEAATKAVDLAKQALKDAFAAEKQEITDAYQLELARMNESLSETQDIISDLQKSVDKLRNAKEAMKLVDEASVKANYLAAKIQLMMVLQQARVGNFSGIAGLDKTLETLTSAGPGMYATAVDYKRDFYHTYSAISELEKLTGSELSTQEQALELQKKEIELLKTNYDAELKSMDDQLNALLGINTSVLSIPQAIANLISANIALSAATGTQFMLGGNVNDLIGGIYEALLGREADIGGRAFYEALLAAGKPLADIINEILGSPEYAGIAASRGYASGGYHPGGWRTVGEFGPELEYTGPSNIIPLKKTGSNLELISEVKGLRNDLRKANLTIAKNSEKTAKILDRFDSDGMPAERVI